MFFRSWAVLLQVGAMRRGFKDALSQVQHDVCVYCCARCNSMWMLPHVIASTKVGYTSVEGSVRCLPAVRR